MLYPEFPTTNKAALAYALELTKLKGEHWHAIRLPEGNPFGFTHAAVSSAELFGYLSEGCLLIDPGQAVDSSSLGCEMCGKHKRRRFYLVEGSRVCGHCAGRRLGGRPT